MPRHEYGSCSRLRDGMTACQSCSRGTEARRIARRKNVVLWWWGSTSDAHRSFGCRGPWKMSPGFLDVAIKHFAGIPLPSRWPPNPQYHSSRCNYLIIQRFISALLKVYSIPHAESEILEAGLAERKAVFGKSGMKPPLSRGMSRRSKHSS